MSFIKPAQSACRCEGHHVNVTANTPLHRVANLLDGNRKVRLGRGVRSVRGTIITQVVAEGIDP